MISQADTAPASVQDRLDLARAVSSVDWACFLDEKNDADGYDELDQAVQSGRAFFVRVKGDVLALDMDKPSAAPVLADIEALLSMHAITPVVIASGQEGHRHLFARVTDPGLKDVLAVRARAGGIDVRPTIRPPLTPHLLGIPVRLVTPTSVRDALKALQADESRPGLSANIQDQILNGVTELKYQSRSEVIYAIAAGAVNRCWREDDFVAAMTTPGTQASDYVLHDRFKGEDDGWLRKTFAKATALVAANPAHSQVDLAAISALRAHVLNSPWPGRTGGTDQVVLLAIIDKASKAGTLDVDCSQREICEGAGISGRATVSKSLTRLQAAGRIECLQRGIRTGRSTTWRLIEVDPHLLTPHSLGSGSTYDPSHDLFRNKVGMGKTPLRIIHAIESGMADVDQISGKTGISKPTVRKHLGGLKAHGLITLDVSGNWVCPSSRDYDGLAEKIGAAGKGQHQRDVHRAERNALQTYKVLRAARNRSGETKDSKSLASVT
jgi:DNA-binding transcriptional ArsR family regulator